MRAGMGGAVVVDPALWHCTKLNRLQVRGKGEGGVAALHQRCGCVRACARAVAAGGRRASLASTGPGALVWCVELVPAWVPKRLLGGGTMARARGIGLTTLILSGNALTALPTEIGALVSL